MSSEYRILTPNGANFLDFGSVVINSPTVRTLVFENLTHAPLALSLMASQPEDVELYVQLEDCDQVLNRSMVLSHKFPDSALERVTSPQSGDLKERFMETLRELGSKPLAPVEKTKTKVKGREGDKAGQAGPKVDSEAGGSTAHKQSVGAAVAAALRKGGRGRPVQLYGNAVMFKDRSLLDEHEHLDLAAGPPISAHRTSPRSKKVALLDTIESEDKAKLSGQHRLPKLDFAASAKATGLVSKENKGKRKSGTVGHTHHSAPAGPPISPKAPASPAKSTRAEAVKIEQLPNIASMSSSAFSASGPPTPDGSKSPALTGKRAEPRTEMFSASDIPQLSVDNLLVSIEQHDARRATAGSSWTLEEEEVFVKKTISLRKELGSLLSSGRLIPARQLYIPPSASRQLIVIMTPNGSIRPHISTRPKRADSRLFIRLNEFDRAEAPQRDLPVQDLILRSNCVRSVLEVQQTSINMGNCEKGEVKSKTIVIQNKSDSIGLFRLRTSGSIASGDLKLGLGRHGVISAFGRREVANFSFTPSLVGNYQENIVVENVLDSYQDQNVTVKANVRRQPNFSVDPPILDFGIVGVAKEIAPLCFVITNTSKSERTFVIEVASVEADAFAEVSISRDETDAGTALSKEQEEEAEGMLQKLKIARRKGKSDKVQKYESRLTELGVSYPPAAAGVAVPRPNGESDLESVSEADAKSISEDSAVDAPEVKAEDEESRESGITSSPSQLPSSSPASRISALTIVLPASQKTKISVQLLPRSPTGKELQGKINVYEKKNTDETIIVGVMASIGSAAKEGKCEPTTVAKEDNMSAGTSDPLHLALMRHCLELTPLCPISPTAFCVGSTIFLPATSSLHDSLLPHFPSFPLAAASPSSPSHPSPSQGLILGDGYSRQIPGNTHAEANALTNFRSRYSELADVGLPPIEGVLRESDCYATMEPCSIRTSGNPSCSLELVRSKVRTVYLGVEEPSDFVQCEGVQILQKGGVAVRRVVGLEEECLKAARRGTSLGS